jgi:hypothetical protein
LWQPAQAAAYTAAPPRAAPPVPAATVGAPLGTIRAIHGTSLPFT